MSTNQSNSENDGDENEEDAVTVESVAVFERPGDNGKPEATEEAGRALGKSLAETAASSPGQTPASSLDKTPATTPGKKVAIKKASLKLTTDDLERINTNKGLRLLLKQRNIKLNDVLAELTYQNELKQLQVELVKLQRWVQETDARVCILFEGRDAAGKGGAIRRFIEHLNPRSMRVVALPKPSAAERGQWYFQRYTLQLPNKGEIVFWDRSWYNRAVVEPVNNFCTKEQYQRFMQQVSEFENMLYEDGVTIIKFWFSISQEEQLRRFESRKVNPLKQWKLSPIDDTAQALWNQYSDYKEEMLSKTHTSFCPWIIVKANDKRRARLESIRYVLNLLPYKGKELAQVNICHDPNIVARYYRNASHLD